MNVLLASIIAGGGIYWFDDWMGQSFAVFCGLIYFCSAWFYDRLLQARKDAYRRRQEAARADEVARRWKEQVLSDAKKGQELGDAKK